MHILTEAQKNNWPLHGITFHVGSQNTSLSSWSEAIRQTREYILIARKYGIEITHVNMGGGIPAPYTKKVPKRERFINKIILEAKKLQVEFPQMHVIVEPGRALSADTMALITKVLDIKKYKKPPLIIVDTSVYNGLIESIDFFKFDIPIYTDHIPHTKKKYFKIGGFSCDGTDILKTNALMPSTLKENDLIAFTCAGAYSFVYENFHMVSFPEIVPIHHMDLLWNTLSSLVRTKLIDTVQTSEESPTTIWETEKAFSKHSVIIS